MNTKLRIFKIGVLLILQSSVLVFGQSYNLQQFNTVRVAYPYFSNDDYLKKVASMNYNYIILYPNVHGNTEDEIYNNLTSDTRDAVINASRFGLRVIPYVNMTGRWAYYFWHPLEIATGKTFCTSHWEATGWENFFGVNWTLKWFGVAFSPADWTPFGTNRLSPDPTGFDSYLIKILQAIKNGFDAANSYYPLEFIHLDHNELFCGDRLPIGGLCNENSSSLCYGVRWRNTTADQTDKDWIQGRINAGDSPSLAVAKLLVEEAYRRTNQVKQVFGNNVKTIIWGDMWDQGGHGGIDMQLFNGTWGANPAPTVLSLPGLTDEQKNSLKSSLILAHWHYKTKEDFTYGTCLSHDYSFDKILSQTTSNGFKFIYCGCANPTGNPLYSKDQIQYEALQAIISSQGTSYNYLSNCLGFCAASFDNAQYDPNSTAITGYSTLGFMARDYENESPLIPSDDWTFSIDTSKWYRLVFNHSGLCMRPTNGQFGDNLQIEQWPIDNNDNSQLWKFKKGDAPGYYYPINYLGKSLDVLAEGMGSYAGTWSTHNGWNQEFRFDYSPVPGNYFMVDLRSANSGANYVLDVEGVSMSQGAKVHTWTKKTTDYQNQIVQMVEVPDPQNWYRVKFLHSGQYIRPTGGQCGNNIQIEQTPIDLSDTTQIWRFLPGANGYYYPLNTNNKTLDAYGTSVRSWVGTWDLSNSDNQQFRFDISPVTEYYYMIDKRSANYGYNFTLDVEGASTLAGAKVITWTKKTSGYENQIVKLETPFLPQGEISTCLNKDGRVYCFAKGMDNHLYYRIQKTVNGDFNNHWVPFAGPCVSNIAVGKLPNGKIYVFYRGIDSNIHYKRQVTEGVDSWTNSKLLPHSYVFKMQGKVAVSVATSSTGYDYLVVWTGGVSSDPSLKNCLHFWEQKAGQDDEFFQGNNFSNNFQIDTNFAIVKAQDNSTYVFAISNYDHSIQYAKVNYGYFDESVFYTLPGLTADHPYNTPCNNIEAAVNPDGRCEVFINLTNGAIMHNYELTPGGNWAGWSNLINGGWGSSHFKVEKSVNGALEIFVNSYQGTLGHMWQAASPTGWLPQNNPSFQFGSSDNFLRTVLDNPAVCKLQNGNLMVFSHVQRTSNAPEGIYYSYSTGPGSWSTWAPINNY